MSLTPVSSSDEDIWDVPSMQSSYSAEMKIRGDIVQAIDNYGGRDFWYKKVSSRLIVQWLTLPCGICV